jgi:shikimate dehydrogenase
VKLRGTTRLYAILGDPIAQVKSPETFTARFVDGGFDAVLVPAWVPDARLDEVAPALMALGNLDGLLVTVPFKHRMLKYADRLGEAAQTVQALNALRREADGSWSGEMFDGAGFVRAAESKGIRVRGRRVILLGAGGAGSAIAHALSTAGVESIDIVDPLAGRAESLRARLADARPGTTFRTARSIRKDGDMIVNASPVGMRDGDALPADIGPLSSETVVGDVVIRSEPTTLVRHAIACGCAWVDGRAMLAGQADAIMAFFAPGLRATALRTPDDANAKRDGAHTR